MTPLPTATVRSILANLAAAAEAADPKNEASEPSLESRWTLASFDPGVVLAACRHIRVREGFRLAGYQLRAGSNGNGVVLAVPADRELPEPPRSLRLGFTPEGPPSVGGLQLPDWVLRDPMAAIEGDGSPESWFEASMAARWLGELGARWHGVWWSDHRVLADDSDLAAVMANPDAWRGKRPKSVAPAMLVSAAEAEVVFHTYTLMEGERITRWHDTFREGYRVETASEVRLRGPGYAIY